MGVYYIVCYNCLRCVLWMLIMLTAIYTVLIVRVFCSTFFENLNSWLTSIQETLENCCPTNNNESTVVQL